MEKGGKALGACGVLYGAMPSAGNLFGWLPLGLEGCAPCYFAGAVSYLLVCDGLCGRIFAFSLSGASGAELIKEGVSGIPGAFDGYVFLILFL